MAQARGPENGSDDEIEVEVEITEVTVGNPAELGKIHERLNDVSHRLDQLSGQMSAVLGVDGLERTVGTGLSEIVEALKPIAAAQAPARPVLTPEAASRVLLLKAALRQPDWSTTTTFTAPASTAGFIGAAPASSQKESS